MKHELKTDPIPFQAVWSGYKKAEIRRNDRDFHIGDDLLLQETEYSSQEMTNEKQPLEYTGREIEATITHIIEGYGLESGFVALSLHVTRLID